MELAYRSLLLTISAMAASIHDCSHHSSVSRCLRFQADTSCHGDPALSTAMHQFPTRTGAESTENTNSMHWSAVDSRMS